MSLPNALPAALPAAIIETILTGLAVLFLAGADGDVDAARQAASHMLNAYSPRTEDELRLAAGIIGFSFQALEALSQAAAPDVPITRTLRLRSSAVSLSREAARAERRLAQIRKASEQTVAATLQIRPGTEPTIQLPTPVMPTAPTKDIGKIAQAAKANGITWTQAYDERRREARIAASRKRAEAQFGPQSPATVSDHQPIAAAV